MNSDKKLTSKEVRKELNIRACDLMHLREDGIFRADKKGNAYMYDANDVEEYKKKISKNK